VADVRCGAEERARRLGRFEVVVSSSPDGLLETIMANEDQATFWTEQAGPIWLANEEALDASSRPFGLAAMDAADIKSGERVLDVGCGTGTTAVELARRVGPDGHVLGLDISPLLLERARQRAKDAANVEFVEGDAQTHSLDAGRDLVFSRFGVMFFADPVAAFGNLRRTGGRLAFACWQDVFSNLWMALPTIGAASVLGEFDLPPEGAPGPFAFADPERVRTILADAGWSDITVADFRATMDSPEGEAMDRFGFLVQMGPLREKYAEADDDTRRRVVDAVLEAAAPHLSDGQYRLPAAVWIVTARAG
jgi:SAM-dependent methyltransferase